MGKVIYVCCVGDNYLCVLKEIEISDESNLRNSQ